MGEVALGGQARRDDPRRQGIQRQEQPQSSRAQSQANPGVRIVREHRCAGVGGSARQDGTRGNA